MVSEIFYSKELQRKFWLDTDSRTFTWTDPITSIQTNKSDTLKKATGEGIAKFVTVNGSCFSLENTCTSEPQSAISSFDKHHKKYNKHDIDINSNSHHAEDEIPRAYTKGEKTVFLHFSNMIDEIKYKSFANDCLYGPSYVLYNILAILMIITRTKFTFQLGLLHSISMLFYVVFLALLLLLNIGKRLQMFTIKKLHEKLQEVLNYLIDDIFRGELENFIMLVYNLASVSSYISRTLLVKTNSLPIDGIFWSFNGIVFLLLYFKNIRPRILFLVWLQTSVAVVWSTIYMQSWTQSWLFGTCIAYALVFYEIERTQMFAFLKSEEALKEQEKRHQFEVKHDLEIAELKITHEANLRISEINQMRALIGNVAHDLKTPIHSVRNDIERLHNTFVDAANWFPEFQNLLAKNTDTNPMIALEDIGMTCDFMSKSVSRFQDFTQASMGIALTPIIVPFSISSSLKLSCRLMKCQLKVGEESRIKIDRISDDVCDNIMSEKHWFEENVICLLSNALKYSKRGTPVMIKLELVPEDTISALFLSKNRHDEDTYQSNVDDLTSKTRDALLKLNQVNMRQMIRVSVIDGGVGIPKEKIKDLFQPFQQAQRMTGGTGLGLYSMSKRIEALKGFCGVEPRSDGLNGSVFWFAFPYRPDYTDYATTASVFDSESTELAKHPLRFLVVDDTVSVLKMTAKNLRAKGHYVEVIDNGTEALERLKDGFSTQDFDILLTDIQMPTMDGLELTKRFREFEKSKMLDLKNDITQLRFCSNREGKLLIISMSANQYCRDVAIQAGIDHFMEKPFKIKTFLEELESVMVVRGGHGSSESSSSMVHEE